MTDNNRISQSDKGLMGLRTLLLNGEYPAGARLPETALAERLGISRTPLREAMARLVDEGLLARMDTGGCRVASFSMSDVIDAIEVRGVLEGTAARLAAERGAASDQLHEGYDLLARLDTAVSEKDALDFASYVHFNARFHHLLGSLAGSKMISREIDRACRLPLASPSAFLKGQELFPDFQASIRMAQSQHWSILEAIESREGARAEALVREHARLAHRNFKFISQHKSDVANRVPGLTLVEL